MCVNKCWTTMWENSLVRGSETRSRESEQCLRDHLSSLQTAGSFVNRMSYSAHPWRHHIHKWYLHRKLSFDVKKLILYKCSLVHSNFSYITCKSKTEQKSNWPSRVFREGKQYNKIYEWGTFTWCMCWQHRSRYL